MTNKIGKQGWCLNVAHPDYLHDIKDCCARPTTLQERMDEMKWAAAAGRFEELTERITKAREQEVDRQFLEIIQNYTPKQYREEAS